MRLPVNEIVCGDNMEVMAGFPDNCIPTIITDPPYGLSFMGKKWDTFKPEYIKKTTQYYRNRKVVKPEIRKSRLSMISSAAAQAGSYDLSRNAEFQAWFTIWGREALRVLMPGGTLLIFGGTRTYHRLACGIEDAGFIIKDCLLWIYGSGFPKATDISKQLDKRKDWTKTNEFSNKIKEVRNTLGLTKQQAFDKCQMKAITFGGNSWFEDGRIPSFEDYKLLKIGLNLNDSFDLLFDEAEREVVGKQKGKVEGYFNPGVGHYKTGEIDVTAPATPEAILWNGWKSHGLKPAYEPILVAMKPNDGTYAENALKWGVSGLNIDGGRIPSEKLTGARSSNKDGIARRKIYSGQWNEFEGNPTQGRFPANVILDEEAAAMLDEQSGVSKPKERREGKKGGSGFGYFDDEKTKNTNGVWPANNGSGASRFFYCAKSSKAERNAGCKGMKVKQTIGGGGINNTDDDVCGKYGSIKSAGHNHHPTVKPLALMQYLARITKTPTGGLVLDPFCGSGTTGMACVLEGRNYIGIEKEPEYVEIANRRIAWAKKQKAGQKGLFE